MSCAKHIWLHVDDVAWVIRVMRHQYLTAEERKGEVGNPAEERNVRWGSRDSAWLCRAKHEGRTYLKSLYVTRRARRACSEYEATKDDAYVAICEWQRRVETGDDPGTGVTIVPSDPSADEVSESAADAEASHWCGGEGAE